MPLVEQRVVDQLENLLLLDEAPSASSQNHEQQRIAANQPLIPPFLKGSLVTLLLAGSVVLVTQNWSTVQAIMRPITLPTGSTVQSSLSVSSFGTAPGVFADKSTITGIIDTQTMTAVYYWGFVLKNASTAQQEAHMEINLPDGAVVSRVTDWINGVPQEAAFNAKGQVQKAYDWVVAGRHEPVIITQIDPNKIDVKAFPITPGGPDMKFCVGITVPLEVDGDGRIVTKLPSVANTNFIIEKQDLHLESTARIAADDSLVRVDGKPGFFVLRMNSGVDKLSGISVSAESTNLPDKFAVPATHSSSPAYIVATVDERDIGFGRKYKLEKTAVKPSCPILNSRHASYRLSSLWAHQEVERLAKSGRTKSAGNLAMAYRIVSSVTGAVVLEMQADYDRFGLHRDMNQKVSPQQAQSRASSGGMVETDQFSSGDMGSQIAPSSESAPILQGATNGTIGPQMGDATIIQGVNTAGTVRVNNLAGAESGINALEQFAGPVGSAPINWLLQTSRDANLFDGGAFMLAPFVLALIPLVFLNYAGGIALLSRGITRGVYRKSGALKLTLLGTAWIGLAYFLPIVSQILTDRRDLVDREKPSQAQSRHIEM